jgi:MGT family glycosyltransferase
MGRYSFVTWDGGGNFYTALRIAVALQGRGHQVTFVAYETQRQDIEDRGFEFRGLNRSGQFDARRAEPSTLEAELVRWVFACREHLDDVPAALPNGSADVVVIDVLMQGALAVVKFRLDMPAVALAHSVIGGIVRGPETAVGRDWLAMTNEFRVAAKLPLLERLTDAWKDLLTLATTIPELDPAMARLGHSMRFIGPIPEQGESRTGQTPSLCGDRQPLVLVSFSTTGFWDQRGRIRNALEALADEPVRVIVTAREAKEFGAVPPNVSILPYLSHAAVLPEANVTITHCGHGTVTASLSQGVPLVGLPNDGADQPFLAKRLAELGVGVFLDGESSPKHIRDAVRSVLTDARYARAARRLRDSIATLPGLQGAVKELEGMLPR